MGPRQGFVADNNIPNNFVKKVGVISNDIIDDILRLQLIKQIKPLQSSVHNYRLGSLLGRGDGKIHDLIDPSLTAGYKYLIPAEYNIKQSKFTSSINNLSYFKYGKALYETIGNILKPMICLFEWVTYSFNQYDTLQIIVKMQDYQLKDGDKYEGNFHEEGLNQEHIIAVGIYYFDIDDTIKGGNLEIQTDVVSSCGGSKSLRSWSPKQIRQGDCIVFQTQIILHIVLHNYMVMDHGKY
eukprot:778277_1